MEKHASGHLGRVFRFLTSTELALFLFLGIAVVSIPGTLAKKSVLYSSPYFVGLLAAFGCNLALCTISRFRTIDRAVLVVHVGVLVVLLGCVVKPFGFVATVNTYEKNLVKEFFRWDLDRDVDLGFSVVVRKIHKEFYPMPIKIGIRKNGLRVPIVTVNGQPTNQAVELPLEVKIPADATAVQTNVSPGPKYSAAVSGPSPPSPRISR